MFNGEYCYIAIDCIKSMCKEDILKLTEDIVGERELNPEDMIKIRRRVFKFLKSKGVDTSKVDFYMNNGDNLKGFTIRPVNLYSFVCLNGFYPRYNKKLFEKTDMYKSPIGNFIFTCGKSSLFFGLPIPEEDVINTLINHAYVIRKEKYDRSEFHSTKNF